MNAYEAWIEVMKRVREIRKAERASGGGANYNFRGVDSVMNAVGPIFRDVGVSCIPVEIKNIQTRDFASKSGGRMHEAIVTVRYRVTAEDGTWFEGESIGESADSSDKAVAQAMSVAYRTFLLQGLTMPTDDPDPDHSWTDRAPEAPLWEQCGWKAEKDQADAWASLIDKAKALPDGPEKDELREWVKGNGYKATTITRDGANEYHRRIQAIEPVPEGDPVKEAGWKSKAERKRTHQSITSRLAKLPAFEAEIVDEGATKLGFEHGSDESLTRTMSVEILTMLDEAEQLVKDSAG